MWVLSYSSKVLKQLRLKALRFPRPGGLGFPNDKARKNLVKKTYDTGDNPIETVELVKGLMRGWFKALKYYKENPVEASEIIAKHYDITPEKY